MTQVLARPVGRGAQQQQHGSAAPLLAYAASSAAGGAVTSLLLWTVAAGLGSVATSLPVAVAAVAIVVSAAADLTGAGARLPQRRRQVPRGWLGWPRRSVTAAAYGFVIGAGTLTFIGHGAVYGLAGVALLAPTWAACALLGAVYGFGRAVPPIVAWLQPSTIRGDAGWWRLARHQRSTGLLLAVTTVLLGGAALATSSPSFSL